MPVIPLDFELSTKRLRLRVSNKSDVDLIWSACRHEGFNDGLTWDPPDQKSELIAYSDVIREKWENGVSYEFVSERTEDALTVGRVGIRRIDTSTTWSIGFWVHPDYWGQGYAAEAARVVIGFGFSELNASKITVAHAVWNSRSKRVIEKLGFQYTGENPCGFEKNGNPVAEYEYEIHKP